MVMMMMLDLPRQEFLCAVIGMQDHRHTVGLGNYAYMRGPLNRSILVQFAQKQKPPLNFAMEGKHENAAGIHRPRAIQAFSFASLPRLTRERTRPGSLWGSRGSSQQGTGLRRWKTESSQANDTFAQLQAPATARVGQQSAEIR
jgi:hypothetical protein